MFTGLFFALLTGFLWMLYAVILRKSALSGVRGEELMFLSAIALMPAVWLMTGGTEECSALPFKYHFLLLLCGVFNGVAMLLLQKAMILGNGAVAWAVGQSALIGPFFCGLIFWGEPCIAIRLIGALLIPAGILLAASGQKQGASSRQNGSRYRFCMFTAFVLLIFAQSLLAAASTWDKIPSAGLRGLYLESGGVFSMGILLMKCPGKKFHWTRPLLLYVALNVASSLCAVWTQFSAMDALARVNMLGISYPVMLGSCIAGVALYSMFALKEPKSPGQTWGIAIIITGILLLSLGSAAESAAPSPVDTPAPVQEAIPHEAQTISTGSGGTGPAQTGTGL